VLVYLLIFKVFWVFRKIDVDNSKYLSREETLKYWKNNFGKLQTKELFKSVDTDGNNSIDQTEWINFWVAVKDAGYSEEHILEEVEQIKSGQSWVGFGRLDSKDIE